jgi:hypothetical protein
MHSIFSKSFGGLTRAYYVRQFLFGSLFTILICFMLAHTHSGLWAKPEMLILSVVCSVLYPYSRFVYESVIGYIVGDNVFYGNAGTMLIFKFFTMFLCWWFSIFVAPVGLAYLYWRNSRQISQ